MFQFKDYKTHSETIIPSILIRISSLSYETVNAHNETNVPR